VRSPRGITATQARCRRRLACLFEKHESSTFTHQEDVACGEAPLRFGLFRRVFHPLQISNQRSPTLQLFDSGVLPVLRSVRLFFRPDFPHIPCPFFACFVCPPAPLFRLPMCVLIPVFTVAGARNAWRSFGFPFFAWLFRSFARHIIFPPDSQSLFACLSKIVPFFPFASSGWLSRHPVAIPCSGSSPLPASSPCSSPPRLMVRRLPPDRPVPSSPCAACLLGVAC